MFCPVCAIIFVFQIRMGPRETSSVLLRPVVELLSHGTVCIFCCPLAWGRVLTTEDSLFGFGVILGQKPLQFLLDFSRESVNGSN